MLGIIGAMDEEVAQIKEKMTDVTVTSVAGMDFYQGKLGGKDAVVVRSGIGKVNAGMCSQILADRFHISAIVNTGIAGSLRARSTLAISLYRRMRCSMIWMRADLDTGSDRFRV